MSCWRLFVELFALDVSSKEKMSSHPVSLISFGLFTVCFEHTHLVGLELFL